MKLGLMTLRGTTWKRKKKLFCFLKSASSEADFCPSVQDYEKGLRKGIKVPAIIYIYIYIHLCSTCLKTPLRCPADIMQAAWFSVEFCIGKIICLGQGAQNAFPISIVVIWTQPGRKEFKIINCPQPNQLADTWCYFVMFVLILWDCMDSIDLAKDLVSTVINLRVP
jgi:hypothetical protein